ncbi:MAG: flagellar type III secretion system protein FlhB [Rhodobacteraceae bacterium]|nr:flagellar type III secretion system protein FlhB [Paracoccaceae bacterium]
MAQGGGADDGQEKTLDPTPQKLQQAREKGDVPRSLDANAAAAYLALLAVLLIGSETVGVGLGAPLSSFLGAPHLMAEAMLGPNGAEFSARIMAPVAIAVAPLLLAPMGAVLISLIAQRAIVVAPSKIEPKISRIDPISNAGQKYGPSGLMEFLKNFTKMSAISVILIVILTYRFDDYASLLTVHAKALPGLLLEEAMILIGAATGVAVAIALLDLMWQHYDHQRKLRMSFQEMKEEAKQSEGDPHMKQTRQKRGREIANNRMIQEVPKSDVVIVNPTHYAVALKWSRKPGSAPICVAKGVDEIARRIREKAVEGDVPIHSDPPTARALHASVDLGEEIAPEHYQAVAAAIRFADALRKQMRRRPDEADDT